MGLYNIILGVNRIAPALMAVLGFEKYSDVGRFRDAFISNGEIAVYTRNGGGNREHWNDGKEAGPDCDCTGCMITYRIPRHPLYLRDEDDDFDCTYATVYFRFPDEYAEQLRKLDTGEKFDPDKRWMDAIEALERAK